MLATATACLNIRTNAWVTGAFLVVEMAALALLTVLGLVHVERPITALLDPQAIDAATGGLAPLGIAGLVIAVTQGIFSYNGYGGAVYFAEETKNARRSIARAVLLSAVLTVVAEIIPLAAILLGTHSLTDLFGADLPVEAFLDERAGHAVTVFVLVSVALAIVNAIIAIALQSGRLLFAAARDQALPAALAAAADQGLGVGQDAVGGHHRHGCLRGARLPGADGRAAQRHRIDAGLQLRVHRTGGDRHAAPRRFRYRRRLPDAVVADASGGRSARHPGHLRGWCAGPEPVAEPRNSGRHHRGRLSPTTSATCARAPAPICCCSRSATTRKCDRWTPSSPMPECAPSTPPCPGPRRSVSMTGRIAYVGTAADAPTAARRIDAGGRLLTPGIIDSHNHLLLGFDEDAVSLEGAPTSTRCAAGSRNSPGAVPISTGSARRTRCTPSSRDVAPMPPTSTASPTGRSSSPPTTSTRSGSTGRRWRCSASPAAPTSPGAARSGTESTGEPTGWVTDFYTSAMTEAGLAALQADIPMYSPQRRYRKLRSSMRMATALGITTVVEPQVPLAELPLFERALAEGVLTSG